MKVHYDVNSIKPGDWPRCVEVKVQGDSLQCSLALDRTYNLAEAYKKDLHLRFLECDTDQQLLFFIRTWGPLDCAAEVLKRGSCRMSLSECRLFQRKLKAIIGLLTAFKTSTNERTALLEFIEAESADDKHFFGSDFGESPSLIALRQTFKVEGDFQQWLNSASLKTTRLVIDSMLRYVPLAPAGGLRALQTAKGPRVEAVWELAGLRDALCWMIWYDEFTKHPLLCCQECRKIFRATTAHARKFHDYSCAHRAAARNFQRRKRTHQPERRDKHGPR